MALNDTYFMSLMTGLLLGISIGIIVGIRKIISLEEKIARMESAILTGLKKSSKKKSSK